MEVVASETVNEHEVGYSWESIGEGLNRMKDSLVPWVWIFQMQKRVSQWWEWVLRHHGPWHQKTMAVNPDVVMWMVQNIGRDLPSLICFSICKWRWYHYLPCKVVVGIQEFNTDPQSQVECFPNSRKVLSVSFRSDELLHAGLHCPLLSPGVCSNSCLSSQWCYLTLHYYYCLNNIFKK